MTTGNPVVELRVVIAADDYPTAVRFWRDTLGLPLVREFPGPGGGGTLLAAGTATVEIVSREQAAEIDRIETGRAGDGGIRLALEVADSAGLADRAAAEGAEKLAEPVDTPWRHRNVRLTSPEGVSITLFTVLPPEGDQTA